MGRLKWPKLGEVGDTLVEVTMAIAIMGLTMSVSFGTAVRAYNLGQTARERTQISGLAQQQMEALKNFRDAHTWKEFINGGTLGTDTYLGVASVLANGCDQIVPAQNCFHMELKKVNGISMWVPKPGPMVYRGGTYDDGTTNYPTVAGGQNFVGIGLKTTTQDISNPDTTGMIDFVVPYGINSRGSQVTGSFDNTNTIFARLANLDPKAKTRPFASVPPCSAQPIDLVLVIDRSGSMETNWNGQTRIAEVKQVTSNFVTIANNDINIGIVSFSNDATVESGLTPNVGTLQGAINGIATNGGTNYEPGLARAENMLNGGRADARKVVIFMSDGENQDGNAPDQRAARMKDSGIVINSINMTIDNPTDTRSLFNMASPGRYYTALTEDEFESIMAIVKGEYGCLSNGPTSPLLGP